MRSAGDADVTNWVRRLENLRRRVEAEERAAGSLSDYLDYGRPNDREAQRALAAMREHDRRAQAERRRLGDMVADMRQIAPHAIAVWVDAHRTVCTAILAETDGEAMSDAVRRHLAGETLDARNRVLQGVESYVSINGYYLADYETRLDEAMRLAAD